MRILLHGRMGVFAKHEVYNKRQSLCASSKTISLFAKPCLDFCYQDGLIPSGLYIKLRLLRISDAFCHVGGDEKLFIKEAAL